MEKRSVGRPKQFKYDPKLHVQRTDLENPEDATLVMEGEVKKRFDFCVKEMQKITKLWDKREFIENYKRESESGLSLREWGKKFEVTKNTIKNWIENSEKILLEINEIEKKVGSHMVLNEYGNVEKWKYEDDLLEESISILAKCRGVKKEYVDLWLFLGDVIDAISLGALSLIENGICNLDSWEVPESLRKERANL